jgi:hypothetical protein
MLGLKNHRHVFSKKAICLSQAQFFAVAQYLGWVALLLIRLQVSQTSLNIGARCDVMVHSAFFENMWR